MNPLFHRRRPNAGAGLQHEKSTIQAVQTREIHHRMRNSLHLIACTLQLQARKSVHAEARQALEGAARRIDSIARVHEHLYGSGRRDGQPARDYLSSLLRDLQGALLAPDSTRKLLLAPGDVFALDDERLMSLGSIVTELVTNAVKYGTGHVLVALAWYDGRIEIRVEDEGHGFPVGFDVLRDAGFGLWLVHHLCAVSGGALAIDRSTGRASVKAVLH